MGSAVLVVGLDLGKKADFTALAGVEIKTQEFRPKHGRPRMECQFLVRDLGRLPLGTSYPDVADHVADYLWALRTRDRSVRPTLRVDATGVGEPVVDILRTRIPSGVYLQPVTIGAGERYDPRIGEARVGKFFLVSRLQTLFESRRIKLPDNDQTRALIKELQDFERRIDDNTGRETLGAMKTGAHDDLVNALGLAVLIDLYETRPVSMPRSDAVFDDVMGLGF